jgi:adenine-specific DNA-methyltransferase
MRLVHEKAESDLLIDSGFRVLKIDTSNMIDTLTAPDALLQATLTGAIDSVKADRTSFDLLFQVLQDWALDLSEPVGVEQIDGREILRIADGALVACFQADIGDSIVREIAARHPLRAVFLDAGFATDAARINAEQIFREVSPETDVRAI